MPHGSVTKNDILARVYKMKNELYYGDYDTRPGQWQDGAHHSLDRVLDLLQEYTR